MGYGRYSHDAHLAMSQSRLSSAPQEVFTQTRCHELMNPLGVKFRESLDSEAHPSSIGIGFSHHSVPSLSKTATRSAGGT